MIAEKGADLIKGLRLPPASFAPPGQARHGSFPTPQSSMVDTKKQEQLVATTMENIRSSQPDVSAKRSEKAAKEDAYLNKESEGQTGTLFGQPADYAISKYQSVV